ncbi:Beta-monoglucosyldiacylglycerol synthase [Methanosarcinales archaeon]|nr:FG-GAP-like repeat-containing protein [Candidatus Methanoperedens sp.]CAG1005162.1 Beta-monoglucosyldiacylglycerol synthase [Methanosarcinales archaeon]
MRLLDIILAMYIIVLFTLFIYGSNCFVLTYLNRKKKREKPANLPFYPMVTVQLPVYNELYVVERLIRKVAQMDYPVGNFEIQVLDDSTDGTTAIIQRCIGELRNKGCNINHIHRTNRDGYKAGALRNGLNYASGEFIAVFDSDFLPDNDFLKKSIHYFSDTKVGMVQTRWGHINEDYSLLTKAIAIGIDGHFQIEQNSRYSSGLFLNFNGTAGIWRNTTIKDAGGWQDDTLTEDLDLSYRAQLRGWRLVFLDGVVCPAELPVQINAFKRQQFRWAKGSIQCAKKLLPEVWSADIPVFKKFQASVHLTYYAVHPMMVILLLLILPLIFLASSTFTTFFYLNFLSIGTLGQITMYALSQRDLYGGWKSRLKYLPILTFLGTGISANNTKAVVEALLKRESTFERTPKFGIEKNTDEWEGKKYRVNFPIITFIEAGLGIYALIALYFSLKNGSYFLAPFLALYVIGYFYVSGLTILHSIPRSLYPKLAIALILITALALRLYRATMGDLSEDPYQHWLISANLASSGVHTDPISGALEKWPPGYHIMASGVIFLLGRDILWLKLMNILLSLGGIYLIYKIAKRHSEKAGLLAAAFLALNPFEIITSSTSYAEPMAVFFFLLTVYLLQQNKKKKAGLTFLLSAATRYEVWLSLPFLFYGKREKRWYLIAPSLIFILVWSAYSIAFHGFFPESIIGQSQEVLSFEIGKGAVNADITGRIIRIFEYSFISSPLVYAAGLYFAGKNIRKAGLYAFVLVYILLLFFATASGFITGSFRYFSLLLPLICIFAGVQFSKTKYLQVIALISLIIALPFYFSLYSNLDTLYQPMIRAGEFVGSTGADGVISNSPVPLYFTGLATSHLFGPSILKNVSRNDGIKFLEKYGVEYIIYVESPPGELERLFPGMENGANASGLEMVLDPNSWEQRYGAKKVYVYRLSNGFFKSTGSYITSSPLLADIDGDGYNEIIAASDKLYVWKRDGSPLPGFPAKTWGLIASSPSVAYTKSGAIIFVGSDDNRLYAWWYNGSSLSGFPVTTNGDVFSKPLIVDMDGNGEIEVVTGSDDGMVYAFYLNGSTVPGWPQETLGFVSSSPVAADLDGDGNPEIIAGSWDEKLYAWHTNGSKLSGFPLKTGDAIWATPRIIDIDGDGSQDIVAASDMVYAWNNRGEHLPGFPAKTGSYIVASPLVADIDHDGKPEIIVAGDALYVYNTTGALKEGWPIYTGYYFWASPSAGDFDNDGQLEIIVGDWSGSVYSFKADGTVLSGFPKHTGGKIFASAAIGHLNNNGNGEVVAGSWDKNIYTWSVDGISSYRKKHMKPPKIEEGPPVFYGISVSKEYGVLFLAANFSGLAERPKLNYYGDDGVWHPSPMVLSQGMYVGMIAPQMQGILKYYISLENSNQSYRFPEVNYYELKN